eukprot:CAMPEP_0197527506 /NCGR_PEP_ID=MMETSP1318-20131121/21909_1 /TAXON_ID=552666 /ORGANISM="Partenskyella glossopodia, Strain RCC365" /LENGTH=206 /DNA_ID=CAMNT_0043082201 /DNA_START=23 /DNA_END=643 /DNA_ORIENTATION=-
MARKRTNDLYEWTYTEDYRKTVEEERLKSKQWEKDNFKYPGDDPIAPYEQYLRGVISPNVTLPRIWDKGHDHPFGIWNPVPYHSSAATDSDYVFNPYPEKRKNPPTMQPVFLEPHSPYLHPFDPPIIPDLEHIEKQYGIWGNNSDCSDGFIGYSDNTDGHEKLLEKVRCDNASREAWKKKYKQPDYERPGPGWINWMGDNCEHFEL